MSLPDIEKLFNEVADACAKLDARGDGFEIPTDIKRYFSTLWKTATTHDAIISEGLIRLYTSASNSEFVPDASLAKAILAKPLFDAFYKYRSEVLRLVEEHNIPNFQTEFRKKASGFPPSWSKWEEAISKDHTLDPSDKELIKLFLTDSGAFKDIKGLARKGDFAAPALIRAMGFRIDRFSIGNEIVQVSDDNVYSQLIHFLQDGDTSEELGSETDPSLVWGEIRKEFYSAIKKAGITA
jgi:hypothetical protein